MKLKNINYNLRLEEKITKQRDFFKETESITNKFITLIS